MSTNTKMSRVFLSRRGDIVLHSIHAFKLLVVNVIFWLSRHRAADNF